MNQLSNSVNLVKAILLSGLCALFGMIYWSSLLIEKDLKTLRHEMTQIQSELNTLRYASTTVKKSSSFLHRSHMESSYPNLLIEDPFYAKTLPELLGPGFVPHGTFHDQSVGRPKNLHPFSNWMQAASWNRSCTDTVAHNVFGKYEEQAPGLAVKLEARPRNNAPVSEFWVHLRDQVYWSPLNAQLFDHAVDLAPHFLEKHQVTAHDFKFYFDALMNPHVQESGAVALRNFFSDVEEIEVVDDLTFVVRWKAYSIPNEKGEPVLKIPYAAKLLTGNLRPLPRFVYQYFPDGKKIVSDDSSPETYKTNSVWAQNFMEHWARNIIVSCGGWVFTGMDDRHITFQRNPYFYGLYSVLAENRDVGFKDSPDVIWQSFKTGKIDTYTLQPDQIIEWEDFSTSDEYQRQKENNLAVKRIDYNARSYVYIGWNEATPYFKSQKVRLAMTMAIDRQRIIDDILNGMGHQLTGPFATSSPAYDKSITPWPFDPIRAKQLLEEDGWFDRDGDGIRDKEINGKLVPFRFRLTYYVKNPTTKALVSYISTALKDIGIICDLNGVDLPDLSAEFDGKTFDAVVLGWALGSPPEDPKQLWHSAGAHEKGSSNAVGFNNPEADTIVDQLTFESNPAIRRALYHRFHKIIHQQQPYTFLYTPKTTLLYREYIQNVFIPSERQDLIPGAQVDQPQSQIFWIKKTHTNTENK